MAFSLNFSSPFFFLFHSVELHFQQKRQLPRFQREKSEQRQNKRFLSINFGMNCNDCYQWIEMTNSDSLQSIFQFLMFVINNIIALHWGIAFNEFNAMWPFGDVICSLFLFVFFFQFGSWWNWDDKLLIADSKKRKSKEIWAWNL